MNEGEPKPCIDLVNKLSEHVEKVLFSMGALVNEPDERGQRPRIEISAEELDAMLWA